MGMACLVVSTRGEPPVFMARGGKDAAGVWGQGGGFGDGIVGILGPDGVAGENAAGVHGILNGFPNSAGILGETTTAIGVWGRATASGSLAGRFDGPVQVNSDVTVNGNLTVTGAEFAVVPFPDGSSRRLYGMESPESWFEDFGTGYLKNGRAEIPLDAEFASIVNRDDYHVFLSEYDDNNHSS